MRCRSSVPNPLRGHRSICSNVFIGEKIRCNRRMANLYTHQDENIRRTWMLFGTFLILIIGLGWAFSYIFMERGILVFAVAFSIISALVSYWSSDKIALALARAKPIEKKDNPYLWNMVENLCITAGLPT